MKHILSTLLLAAMPIAALAQSSDLVDRAKGGDKDAMYELANDLRWSNEAEALNWYTKAAEAGHPAAACTVAEAYVWGQLGVDEDDAQVLKWYRKAIDNGSGEAAFKLATAYRWGEHGLDADEAQAVKLYEKGGQLSFPDAYTQLGELYLAEDDEWDTEDTIKQDLAKAFTYYKKAVDLYIASDGEYVGTDAYYTLATLYRDGRGCTKNAAEALRLINLAAEQGHEPSRQALLWNKMK